MFDTHFSCLFVVWQMQLVKENERKAAEKLFYVSPELSDNSKSKNFGKLIEASTKTMVKGKTRGKKASQNEVCIWFTCVHCGKIMYSL